MSDTGIGADAVRPATRPTADPPVFDGHNDFAWAIRERRGSSVDGLDARLDEGHTDLVRLREGGVGGQFWSVWVDGDLPDAEQVPTTLEQIDLVHRLIARYPETLRFCRTAADARAAIADGRIASLIGVEGGAQIQGSLAVLRDAVRLGARYMTLTWSRTIPWADSSTDVARSGGLADFGREVVTEMNRIGMVLDLAHVADTTMRDALAATRRPVLVTHSGARALCDHPRNVPDELIAAIGASGGVQMVAFVPSFVNQARRDWVLAGEPGEPPRVTVADVADHIEHVREVAGVDAVGIGADYDGTGSMPEGLDDVSRYPALLHELRARGWSEAELRKLASENVLRVLEASDDDLRRFLGAFEPGGDARSGGSTPRVLVVVNSIDSGPRRLVPWLLEAGLALDVRTGAEGIPTRIDGYDGLVMLGGGFMPDDFERAHWLAQERALALDAIARDTPTLGICLGGQLLADVAGGEVRAKHGTPERGSTVIRATPEGAADAAGAALAPEAPMIEHHEDAITRLPDDAVLLASSEHCPIQAFRIGSHVRGVQFHPEVGSENVRRWNGASLAAEGIDLDDLVAVAEARDTENETRARALVEAFAAEVTATAAKESVR